MKELGEAINNSLSESDQIAHVITRIKEEGFDIFLVLEATIGFNRRDEESTPASPELVSTRNKGNPNPEFAINANDALSEVSAYQSGRRRLTANPPCAQSRTPASATSCSTHAGASAP